MIAEKSYSITPIGYIHTGFSSKFGIPRQSGLVVQLCGEITFEKKFSSPDFFRGLEGFSHIWAIWLFSETAGKPVSATVRPPKLGGNTKMGVFATRSPYRPNSIALSVLKLERIEYDTSRGTVLYVKGADMLDGTPIIDIKPYIPFADCVPGAVGGFAQCEDGLCAGKTLAVKVSESVISVFPSEHRDELLGILSQDPRPGYIDDKDRIFAFEFYGFNIRFKVCDDILEVLEISTP